MTLTRMFVASMLLCACAERRTSDSAFALELHVRTDTRDVVQEASIAIDNAARGVTDDEGFLRVELAGTEGQRVHVDVTCPVNYRAHAGGLDVVLRGMRGLGGQLSHVLPVDAECIPLTRRGALVVRAQGAA